MQADENADCQTAIFGHPSAALQNVTPQRSRQLQSAYQQELQQEIERKKIPMDEIDALVASLTEILDDLETVLAGGDPYRYQNALSYGDYVTAHRQWKLGQWWDVR